VKSPNKAVHIGMQGLATRNSGTFSRNRDVLDQHAKVCAKAAANIIAGVTHRRLGVARNSAFRVSGSTHCQRRVLLQESTFRLVDGSLGGSGSSGIRCDHQSRSAS